MPHKIWFPPTSPTISHHTPQLCPLVLTCFPSSFFTWGLCNCSFLYLAIQYQSEFADLLSHFSYTMHLFPTQHPLVPKKKKLSSSLIFLLIYCLLAFVSDASQEQWLPFCLVHHRVPRTMFNLEAGT